MEKGGQSTMLLTLRTVAGFIRSARHSAATSPPPRSRTCSAAGRLAGFCRRNPAAAGGDEGGRCWRASSACRRWPFSAPARPGRRSRLLSPGRFGF